jgi:DNA polymerase
MPGATLQQIAALLRWYEEAGVDEIIAEAPPDTSAAPAPPPPAVPVAAQEPPAAPPVLAAAVFRPAALATALMSPEALEADARAAAAAAPTLEALAAAIGRYDGCALKLTATNLVFADGNPKARLMVVGEAPGAEEDRRGLPFVGRAGQLLDRMLAAIGLDRSSAYITNVLPWRPPGNRQPSTGEIAACLPFLHRHIALVAPRVLVMAGGTSAKALLATGEGITRLRGRWFELAVPGLAAPVSAMAIYHPAYLLRQPALKREAWRDLLRIRKALDEAG